VLAIVDDTETNMECAVMYAADKVIRIVPGTPDSLNSVTGISVIGVPLSREICTTTLIAGNKPTANPGSGFPDCISYIVASN
jgi:hypothetical protein